MHEAVRSRENWNSSQLLLNLNLIFWLQIFDSLETDSTHLTSLCWIAALQLLQILIHVLLLSLAMICFLLRIWRIIWIDCIFNYVVEQVFVLGDRRLRIPRFLLVNARRSILRGHRHKFRGLSDEFQQPCILHLEKFGLEGLPPLHHTINRLFLCLFGWSLCCHEHFDGHPDLIHVVVLKFLL